MAIKLSDLQKATRKITIDFQGGSLEVEYRLNVITPAFLNAKLTLPDQLKQAVVRWDLTDDQGQELSVTEELLNTLPVELQAKINTAIADDMRVASDEQKND